MKLGAYFELVNLGWMTLLQEILARSPGDGIIRHGPSHQRARAGSTVSLRCFVDVGTTNHSFPLITWKKDSKAIEWRNAMRMTRQESGQLLTIANLSTMDNGLYACIARSADGMDRASAQLVVEDIPDSPVDVALVSCENRVAQLRWRLVNENSSPVIQYIIEFNTSFQPDHWQVAKTHLPRNKNYQRITLSPWGNYSFRIIAVNSIGRSVPSSITNTPCSTPPDVPHVNPRGVCTLNMRPRTLAIVWQLMTEDQHNAPGFHYVVRWRRLSFQQSNRTVPGGEPYLERSVEVWSDRLVLTNQPIYKPFQIYVLAVNEIGEAVTPPQMLIGNSGEDVPLEVPKNFQLDGNKPVTDRTADFRWTSVKAGSRRMRGFFRGYKIQYWISEDKEATMREHYIIYGDAVTCLMPTSGLDRSPQRRKRDVAEGQIYNLWPNTNITAQVLVLNSKYSGRPSAAINFTTASRGSSTQSTAAAIDSSETIISAQSRDTSADVREGRSDIVTDNPAAIFQGSSLGQNHERDPPVTIEVGKNERNSGGASLCAATSIECQGSWISFRSLFIVYLVLHGISETARSSFLPSFQQTCSACVHRT